MKKFINVREHFRTDHKTGKKVRAGYKARLQRLGTVKDFYGRTATEADAKRASFKDADSLGSPDPSMTIGHYLTDLYIAALEQRANTGNLSYAKYKERKSRIERFVKDTKFSLIRLSEVRAADVRFFFGGFVRKGEPSPEVLRTLRTDLRAAFGEAQEYLPKDAAIYFRKLDLPEVITSETEIFDPDLIYGICIDESKPIYYRALLAFQAYGGGRTQDTFGLKWTDLDVTAEEPTVAFTHAVKRTKDGWRDLPGGKTGRKGIRTNPLGALLTYLFIRLRQETPDREYVFTTVEGGLVNKDHFNKVIWPKMKVAVGLPEGPTFYSLKHLGTSYGMAHGVPLEVMQKHLGHTSPRMILAHYRKLLSGEQRRAASVLDRGFIPPALPSNVSTSPDVS